MAKKTEVSAVPVVPVAAAPVAPMALPVAPVAPAASVPAPEGKGKRGRPKGSKVEAVRNNYASLISAVRVDKAEKVTPDMIEKYRAEMVAFYSEKGNFATDKLPVKILERMGIAAPKSSKKDLITEVASLKAELEMLRAMKAQMEGGKK